MACDLTLLPQKLADLAADKHRPLTDDQASSDLQICGMDLNEAIEFYGNQMNIDEADEPEFEATFCFCFFPHVSWDSVPQLQVVRMPKHFGHHLRELRHSRRQKTCQKTCPK